MMKKKLIKSILLILIFLLALNFIVVADDKSVEEQVVDMVFFQTDLREVLTEITLQTGVNIIPDETVRGVVTAELNEVPLEEALHRILIGGGYTYKKIDDFYLVGLASSNNKTFSNLVSMEVVKLDYITVEEVLQTTPSFLKDYISGAGDSNVLTLMGPEDELVKIQSIIDRLDKAKKQIKVEVIITEVDSEKITELGINYWSHKKGQSSDRTFSYGKEGAGVLFTENNFYGQLLTNLKVLESNQEATIEANPNVLVADGEEAKLFLGSKENILISSNDSDVRSKMKEFEAGIGLEVTPKIRGDKEIELKIAPKINHFNNLSDSHFRTKENYVSTTLLLESGQTAVLAGMTKTGEREQSSGVPVLGRIPIVRWLFRRESSRESDRELLIMVKPVIQ